MSLSAWCFPVCCFGLLVWSAGCGAVASTNGSTPLTHLQRAKVFLAAGDFRRAVDACPFDDDAELVWPGALKRLVQGAGFLNVRLDYIVFFPRLLRALRPLEPYLGRVFLGAQTMTLGTSPERT